jgi:hypothetical protein
MTEPSKRDAEVECMNIKKLHGKDGEMILTHKGVKFADAERFTAELAEQSALVNTGKPGTYSIGTGYRASLRLNDVTITDDKEATGIINGLNGEAVPEIGFQGRFRRDDGVAEKIVFRHCALQGELDLIGLAKGFVWDLDLAVNSLTEEQITQFQIHG